MNEKTLALLALVMWMGTLNAQERVLPEFVRGSVSGQDIPGASAPNVPGLGARVAPPGNDQFLNARCPRTHYPGDVFDVPALEHGLKASVWVVAPEWDGAHDDGIPNGVSCSGTVLVTTDGSQRPYLLTASQCLGRTPQERAENAKRVRVFWGRSVRCGDDCFTNLPRGSCPLGGAESEKYVGRRGARLLAEAHGVALLEMLHPAPHGSSLAGWSRTEIAYKRGHGEFAHHWRGGHKRRSLAWWGESNPFLIRHQCDTADEDALWARPTELANASLAWDAQWMRPDALGAALIDAFDGSVQGVFTEIRPGEHRWFARIELFPCLLPAFREWLDPPFLLPLVHATGHGFVRFLNQGERDTSVWVAIGDDSGDWTEPVEVILPSGVAIQRRGNELLAEWFPDAEAQLWTEPEDGPRSLRRARLKVWGESVEDAHVSEFVSIDQMDIKY